MKTKSNKVNHGENSEPKLNNEYLGVLRKIKVLGESVFGFSYDLIDFVHVIDSYELGFYKDREKYPSIHELGMAVHRCEISNYQKFCLRKLSSVLYDAKILYENNIIDFSQFFEILLRVRNDAYKRFKTIQKSASKQSLKNRKLDKDSLVLLQAKLAIIENEN